MRLNCEVSIVNRLAPSLSKRNSNKPARAASGDWTQRIFQLVGAMAEKAVFLLVCTAKERTGTKYKVKGNLQQVLSKFLEKGKATICLKGPPHDLFIDKADPSCLKSLLSILKLGDKELQKGKLSGLTPAKASEIEKPKTEMVITRRSDYPLGKPFPSSLSKLSISNCRLLRIEARILQIQGLTCLNLAGNQIKEIPCRMAIFSTLSELNFHGNRIREFPAALCNGVLTSSLRFLDLSQNEIKLLPVASCNFENLVHLKLDRNQIHVLPVNIGKLSSLCFLSASHNQLTVLPCSLSTLRLESIDVSENPFLYQLNWNFVSKLAVPPLKECARIAVKKNRVMRTRLQDQSTEEAKFNILNPDGTFAAEDAQPGSLQQHCRTSILQSLGLKHVAGIVKLPIPQKMVNFLANQLSLDDFYVNRNNLNSEHMTNFYYPAKCLLDMSEVVLKCVPQCLADDRVKSTMEAWKEVSHPNITRSLVQFSQGGTEIIVFEYPPVTLVDLLTGQRELHRLLPEYLIWKAFCGLCSAIKYLNDKGILYKTSKPTERISFDENGTLKLDSGLLYMASAQDNMNAMAMADNNTGLYSPPEVLKGQQFCTSSQVWLLGCVLYELTTMEPSYKIQGTDMFTALSNIMEGRPPPDINASFSDDLKSTINNCLEGDPESRPSVEELTNRATVVMDRMKETYQGPEIVDL